MQHKTCFEAVRWTLNDICYVGDRSLFGGITTVLGGDFAQILPVARRGSRPATVQASLRHSSIWSSLHILRLSTTMRIAATDSNQVLLDFLKRPVFHHNKYVRLELPA